MAYCVYDERHQHNKHQRGISEYFMSGFVESDNAKLQVKEQKLLMGKENSWARLCIREKVTEATVLLQELTSFVFIDFF